MPDRTAPTDLTGQLLIAMPGMGDPRFAHAVVFLCSHGTEGAMGLIVNKPVGDLSFRDVMEQLGLEGEGPGEMAIGFGGPVETERGFVLHSADYVPDGGEPGERPGTLRVDDDFAMTATLDIIEDIAEGGGPRASMLAFGYSGWGPGQLENEIADNGWLTCEATPKLVFGGDMDAKWEAALTSLAEGGSMVPIDRSLIKPSFYR